MKDLGQTAEALVHWRNHKHQALVTVPLEDAADK